MASVFGDATKAGAGGRQPSPPWVSERPSSRSDGGLPGMENETGTAAPASERSEDINRTDIQVSPSLEPSVDLDKQDSDYENRNRDSDNHVNRISKRTDFTSSQGVGGVRLSSSNTPSRQEQELWQRLESIMATKQSHVQQVLEEFGIADVQPSSDELEEQVWKVVEGELTLQEAADLV